MKTLRWINSFVLLMLLPLFFGTGPTVAARVTAPATPQARTTPLIIDHTSTDITAVPQAWIEEAKRVLHIGYGHTSHGSQLTDGMSGLIGFANNGGLGLALPDNIFRFSTTGNQDGLYLHYFEGDGYGEGDLDHDAGYYPNWVEETYAYLGALDPNTGRGTNHPEMNVIMWSWCGQVSWYTEDNINDWYLMPMTQLELDYPGVTFVYMTGHSDGSGEEGNLHLRNQQIRDYCIAHNKVLYDFYNIELYDPDGNYFGDKAVNDECWYDSDGNGTRDKNWALDWQSAHTEGTDWYECSCAHSESLNCNQKAYAVWALWARLAGWDGGISALEASKTSSQAEATPGEAIIYTVAIQASGTPPTETVTLNDAVPAGLAYVPGSLTATSGTVNDAAAPALTWTGLLTPTPAVTVTYAVTVDTTEWGSITNTAIIAAEGQEPLTRTATVEIVRPADYPDLTPSFKTVSMPSAYPGDRVTYTVGIRNATGPLSLTAVMSDVIQPGLVYIPGTFTATSGDVDETQAPLLQWTGLLTPMPAVTVTYAVTVATTEWGSITNTAVIVAEGQEPLTRMATVEIVRPADYPDLTPSFKTVSTPYANHGDRVTYTVGIRNATGPLSLTAVMSDVLRPGLVYIPGTFTATSGDVDETWAPLLQWTGVLSPSPDITLTYAAIVTYPDSSFTGILPAILTNQVNIAVPGYTSVTRSVTLSINMFRVYLPVVLRSR